MTFVRELVRGDWAAVEEIYRAGIDAGNATFEAGPPTWDAFDSGRLRFGRLVAVDDARTVIGWVAGTPVSSRAAYRGVVEHSIYVVEAAHGRGVGRALLKAFIATVEMNGVWTIQSSVFPENAASRRLHESVGFREVGRRERIARATVGPWAGQWRDTILIERRSTMNGLR